MRRLGVVSDTHGQVANARRAAVMLESLGVDAVLHCGDVGSAAVVEQFSKWPTHFVGGNTDDWRGLRSSVEKAGQTFHGEFGSLEFEGVRVAFLHGDDGKRLAQAIAGGDYQLVCHGHTHRAVCRRQERALVLNPGALYRADRHTIAIVELPELRADIIEV